MSETNRVLRHENTIRRALWPPVLALGLLAVLLVFLIVQLVDTTRRVDHSAQVLNQANHTLRLAVDMETGKRGFFLAGDRHFLEPYNAAAQSIPGEFDWLERMVADSPAQQDRAKAMRQAFLQWKAQTDQELENYHATPTDIRSTSVKEHQGKQLMDAVRQKTDEFTEQEEILRTRRVRQATTATRWAFLGGTIGVVLIGGFIAITTHRQMRFLSTDYETVIETEQRVRERLATTLTSIGDAVMVTDAKGIITMVNPITEELTGWTNEEARGKDSKIIFDIRNESTGEVVESPVEQAIRENRTVLLANHAMLKRRDGTMIHVEDSAAPVRDTNGQLSGIVLVFRDVSRRKKQEAEIAAANERNQRIAETLQRSMLLTPPPDAFPGLSFTTLYEPAWEEAQVGGDFYDAFALGEDHVALVMGDATGKGLVAAATTSEVKYALRAYLYENPDPMLAVSRLNRYLASQNREEDSTEELSPMSFISIAVAVVDTKNGTGQSVVAGGEPPLLLQSQFGIAHEVGTQGMMLGVSPESEYEAVSFAFDSGDILAFVTDGITEARRGRSEFFGYEGFTQALLKAAVPTPSSTPLPLLASSITAEAKVYAGGKLQDDVCLLLARRA